MRNEWNLNMESCKVLGKLCKGRKNALEIGTGEGFSTFVLAANCSKVVTIERDNVRLMKAKKRLEKYCNVVYFLGDALEVIPLLDEKFDFVFIDGMKKEYLSYLRLIKLTEDAVIVADNVISHASKVEDYLKYVRSKFDSSLIEVGKGLEVSRKV